MGGRRCEGYGVCSDAAQQHFATGKMLGGRSAVKKALTGFFDKLTLPDIYPEAFLFVLFSLAELQTLVQACSSLARHFSSAALMLARPFLEML